MPPDLYDVTDAELAVLQTLWEHGPATIRQLADILYPGGKAAQYGTVQKLLERLEGKTCVRRDLRRGLTSSRRRSIAARSSAGACATRRRSCAAGR